VNNLTLRTLHNATVCVTCLATARPELEEGDVYSEFARQRKLVQTWAQLLGVEHVEHFHHKLIMKDPPKLDTSTGETPLYGAALDSNHQQKGLCSA
jgi:hypothetical protein